MKFTFHHIAIAVGDLDEVRFTLTEAFGLKFKPEEFILSQKVKSTFAALPEANIELVQATDLQSPLFPILDHPVLSFVKSRGNGLHHICFQVDDLVQSLAYLEKQGIQTLKPTTVQGTDNRRIVFLNPNNCNGLLIELIERHDESKYL